MLCRFNWSKSRRKKVKEKATCKVQKRFGCTAEVGQVQLKFPINQKLCNQTSFLKKCKRTSNYINIEHCDGETSYHEWTLQICHLPVCLTWIFITCILHWKDPLEIGRPVKSGAKWFSMWDWVWMLADKQEISLLSGLISIHSFRGVFLLKSASHFFISLWYLSMSRGWKHFVVFQWKLSLFWLTLKMSK